MEAVQSHLLIRLRSESLSKYDKAGEVWWQPFLLVWIGPAYCMQMQRRVRHASHVAVLARHLFQGALRPRRSYQGNVHHQLV